MQKFSKSKKYLHIIQHSTTFIMSWSKGQLFYWQRQYINTPSASIGQQIQHKFLLMALLKLFDLWLHSTPQWNILNYVLKRCFARWNQQLQTIVRISWCRIYMTAKLIDFYLRVGQLSFSLRGRVGSEIMYVVIPDVGIIMDDFIVFITSFQSYLIHIQFMHK